jgi:hypothetical protein
MARCRVLGQKARPCHEARYLPNARFGSHAVIARQQVISPSTSNQGHGSGYSRMEAGNVYYQPAWDCPRDAAHSIVACEGPP